MKIASLYGKFLKHPHLILSALFALCVLAILGASNFYFDASADSLVAEDDPQLAYYRKVSKHFGDEGYLFLTYTPKNHDLFSRESVANIKDLTKRLTDVRGVSGVMSLLDAPLLKSPPIPIEEMSTDYKTVESDDVDFKAAQQELTNSPLFKNLVVSTDGETTAIRIDLRSNAKLKEVATERNALRLKENLNADEQARLEVLNDKHRILYQQDSQELNQTLEDIRQIRDSLQSEATAYLGGVPMIAADMKKYVKSDVLTFGLLSIILMTIALAFFFKRLRWVVVTISTAGVTVLLTVGFLGSIYQPVTVISSNFVSILIILTISMVVHLIARYREERTLTPDAPKAELTYRTMVNKFAPCFYTVITTMAAFASLMSASIIPVIDFGWIMCLGIGIGFLVSFTLFPSLIMLLPDEKAVARKDLNLNKFLRGAFNLAVFKTWPVLVLSVALAVATTIGLDLLRLDNRFVDYFKDDTEIHKGLTFIDQNLGGTMPMDVIIEFPPYEEQEMAEDDFFATQAEAPVEDYPERYWFTSDKISQIAKMEDYLNERPEVGKVISISTLEEVARDFNNGEPLGSLEIVAVLGALPDNIRQSFIAPYAEPRAGLMRIATRTHETGKLYDRDALISDIYDFATTELNLPKDRVHVTGMNVLFNGMLKDLFTSQTSTIAFVILAAFIMFWILLRRFSLALMGIGPNLLAALSILGLMGFMGMPLDMMTLTIASIVIGIGVDDAIHYLHCFRESHKRTKDIRKAIEASHKEVGRAMYFTTLTVCIGFSVLVLSNFVPSVYFGILSSLAMVFALLANLVILPALLMKFTGHKK